MNSFKEDWFQCMLELIEKVESNAMETEEDVYKRQEFTFTPNGGYMPFQPKDWDFKVGKLIDIDALA